MLDVKSKSVEDGMKRGRQGLERRWRMRNGQIGVRGIVQISVR